MTRRVSTLAALAALGALSACSISGPVYSPAPPPPAPEPRPPEPRPRPEDATAADPRAQTVDAMLDNARNARVSGNLVQAESTLESALRIAPGDARLWLELAQVQFSGGNFDAAANFAERAASLAGNDEYIRKAAADIHTLSAQ